MLKQSHNSETHNFPFMPLPLTLFQMKSSGYRYVTFCEVSDEQWNMELKQINVHFKMLLWFYWSFHGLQWFILQWKKIHIMFLSLKITLNFMKGVKYSRKPHHLMTILCGTFLNSRKNGKNYTFLVPVLKIYMYIFTTAS